MQVADKSFNAVHAARGLAALRGVAGDLVKELGPLNPADVEQAKARKVSTRNRDFKTDETNLSPFAKVALHAVERHAIVVAEAIQAIGAVDRDAIRFFNS